MPAMNRSPMDDASKVKTNRTAGTAGLRGLPEHHHQQLVADWISGWDKPTADGATVPVAGNLDSSATSSAAIGSIGPGRCSSIRHSPSGAGP